MKKEKRIENKVQEVEFLIDQEGDFGAREVGDKVFMDLDAAKIYRDRKIVKYVNTQGGKDGSK
jgi:hypothetical protein